MTELVQISETQSRKAVTANENFHAVGVAKIFGAKLSECVGLTWSYYGGWMLVDGVLTLIADDTLTLTDNDDNYIYVDDDGAVGIVADPGSPPAFTAGVTPLYIVSVLNGVVTSYTDVRAFQPQQSDVDLGGPKKWITHPALTSLTDGTNATPANGTRYWAAVFVPHRVTLTGIAYLIGTVGGTTLAIAELKDSAGASVANSALAGATVGTLATFQQLAFDPAPVTIDKGWYFLVLQFDGNTARFRTIPANLGTSQVQITGSAAGTFGTLAAITPGTTFTAGVGPIAHTY